MVVESRYGGDGRERTNDASGVRRGMDPRAARAFEEDVGRLILCIDQEEEFKVSYS